MLGYGSYRQIASGEVAEWSNAPVSKTGVPQGTGSSNLPLSANEKPLPKGAVFRSYLWKPVYALTNPSCATSYECT